MLPTVAIVSVHACPLGRLGSRETGGMNVYVRELATELAKQGLAVDVFTRRTDPADREVVEMAAGATLVRVTAGEIGPMDKNAVYDYLPQFVAGVERYRRGQGRRYDVVHSHYWLSGRAGIDLAARWHAPHLTMFHTLGEVKNRCGAPGQESELRIAVERQVVHSVDRTIAASEDELHHLVDLYDAEPRRVTIVPCGVNTRLFSPLPRAEARAKLGLNGHRTALFVGRMDPLKGLDLLLLAAHELRRSVPDLQLLVVGGDASPESEEGRVRDLARELGLADRVTFVGAVPQTELPTYYSAADLCVVPSFYESFGLVAVEALACGTPVVASRVGGLPGVVKHGENGLLVANRTASDFAASIGELCRDEGRRAGLALRARASVARLVWESVARRILQVYDETLAAAGPAGALSSLRR
ncbi:MAG: glycosyltransferase [Chloroflexi bacterium]|nr:glycosyltransferase [Chloroflexota bacterium]